MIDCNIYFSSTIVIKCCSIIYPVSLVNIEIAGYFRLHQILDSELYVLHVNTDLILYEDTISFYFMIRISA